MAKVLQSGLKAARFVRRTAPAACVAPGARAGHIPEHHFDNRIADVRARNLPSPLNATRSAISLPTGKGPLMRGLRVVRSHVITPLTCRPYQAARLGCRD